MSGTVPLAGVDRKSDHSLSEIVSVRLSAEDVERLNAIARQEQRSVSTLIRWAIELFVEERLQR